ncbi:hypothetical protein JFL53_07975 [Histophilus somni]|nr:hypothetical protein JFL53_07975 [Histophilus somni]
MVFGGIGRQYALTIGRYAYAKEDSAIAIGRFSFAKEKDSFAIGSFSQNFRRC